VERVLVLAPHADDAEFGLGGTLHRLAHPQAGQEAPQIRVVTFAWGDYLKPNGALVGGDVRLRETIKAMLALGVTDHRQLFGFRENEGDTAGFRNVVRWVEQEIKDFEPDTLFTCLPSFNQDHEVLHKATITALRPGRFDTLRRVYGYEYPGNFWMQAFPMFGQVFSRLSKTDLVRKIESLHEHHSQFDPENAVFVSPAGAENLALLRGIQCGTDQAELFYLMREIMG
jgi:LmbE family N-acetylglucosaminyl deacetylase